MKDKVNYFNSATFIVSATIFLIILESCAPSKPSLKKLSITEPERVVSKQDSLLALSKERRPEFVAILSTAHINIARKAESSGNRETALKEYKKVLAIDPQNKTARYELLLLEGLTLYKKGSKPALWDAIEIFSKASMINQEDGVASYWIAKSYRDSYGMFISVGFLSNHESPLRGDNFVTSKIIKGITKRGQNCLEWNFFIMKKI